MLSEVWQEGSPGSAVAVRSFKMHVQNYTRPDMRAFMIGIFGQERMMKLLKLEKTSDE